MEAYNEFSKRLVEVVQHSNIKELAIVVDGKYSVVQGKLVYARINDKGAIADVEFYTKKKSDVVGKVEKNELPTFKKDLFLQSLKKEIYGIRVPGEPSLSKVQMQVCTEMKLLLIESHLYRGIRMSVESDNSNNGTASFFFGTDNVGGSKLVELKNAFRRESYSDYGKLIYGSQSNRFLNRANKYDKFFSIQRAFIPFFIDYKKVYNPYRNNDSLQKMKIYEMLQHEDMQRRKRATDNLEFYYLTHREICEALDMTHFMRFTPEFLYRLLTGLMHPEYKEFPNKNERVLIRPEGMVYDHIYKRVLSIPEASKIGNTANAIIEDPNKSEEEKKSAMEELNELKNYERVDSLFAACVEHSSRLTNIGSPSLDAKANTTPARLYSYVEKARIVYV